MWTRDPALSDLIRQWWGEVWVGNQSKMFLFHKKITHIKWKLKEWNNLHFKNIFVDKDRIEKELRALNDIVMEKGMSEVEFINE